MIPSSLIPDLRVLRPDKSPEENLLNARLYYRFLADHARELQLNDGRFIGDVVDFADVLRQIAMAARSAAFKKDDQSLSAIADRVFELPAPIVNCDVAGSGEKCGSRYHDPARAYCLECIPAGAPLGVLLIGTRLPAEQEIIRGLAESGESGREVIQEKDGMETKE